MLRPPTSTCRLLLFLLSLLGFVANGEVNAQLPAATATNEEVYEWMRTILSQHRNLDSVLTAEPDILIRADVGERTDPALAAGMLYTLALIRFNANIGSADEDILALNRRALSLARRAERPALIAEIHLDAANLFQALSDPTAAEKELFAALDIFDDRSDSSAMMQVYRELCDISRATGEYDEALAYAHTAFDYHDRAGVANYADDARLCALATLQDADRHTATLDLARQMLDYRAAHPDWTYANLHYVYTMQRNALLALGRTEEAIPLTDSLLGELRKYGEGAAMYYYGELGHYHYLRDDYAAAAAAFDTFIPLAEGAPPSSFKQTFQEVMLATYLARGDDAAAVAAQDALRQTVDSLHAIEIAGMRSELRREFETERRDELISRQQDRLDQQRKSQLLMGGLAAVLGFGLLGLFISLRVIGRKNGLLTHRNRENELLLREIHHRVKNNLEIISSLLELQSVSLTEGPARDAMTAGQSRVQSMGLLHQRLYQGSEVAVVGMQDYFENLADSLLETYGKEEQIAVEVKASDTLLDIDSAVPLGLIVNELLTNSIKYAYRDDRRGLIGITLRPVDHRSYVLTVRDDGPGKSPADSAQAGGFGHRMVTLLIRQLGGVLREYNDGGLVTELRFQSTAPRLP